MSLLIVGILVLILFFIMTIKQSNRIKWKFMTNKGTRWILIIYAIVLVSSLFINNGYSTARFKEYRTLSEKELLQLQHGNIDIYQSAVEGNVDKVKGIYSNKKWELDYKGAELEIVRGDTLSITVFVEKKETNDGKIEVVSYGSELIVEDVVLKDQLNPPELQLIDNRLRIIQPVMKELNYTMFDKEFTITQFTQDRSREEMYESSLFMGSEILYLRVPKDLKIKGDFQLVEN